MIHHGDSLEVMRTLQANSVDAIVTDPPYGWGFMGKAWDKPAIEARRKEEHARPPRKDGKSRGQGDPALCAGLYDLSLTANKQFQLWTESWAREVFRVLKPGGHALIFCGPRTYHRMASGVEDAGFEIRDQLQWLFGSGFPKSHNLGDGRGTALKPANEPIVLARKPLEKGLTVAENVLKWGTGAINVDASRIEGKPRTTHKDGNFQSKTKNTEVYGEFGLGYQCPEPAGRWPANVLFDEEAAVVLDEQTQHLHGAGRARDAIRECEPTGNLFGKRAGDGHRFGDSGGASRFFYVAKTSKRERNAGLEGMPARRSNHAYGEGFNSETKLDPKLHTEESVSSRKGNQNNHPTVKPIKLMEYLIKLITPPGGVVLDPFMGSGSTGCAAMKLGYAFIGIEREAEYVEIARRRIEHWSVA